MCSTQDRQKGKCHSTSDEMKTRQHTLLALLAVQNTLMFSNFYSLEGFLEPLSTHSTVISLTSAKKGLITTVPNAGTSDCSTLPAHRMLSSCQKSSLGLPQCCRKAQEHLHLPVCCLPELLHHRKSAVAKKTRHRIDGSLLLGGKKEQRRSRTEGPTRTESDHKVSFCQRTGAFLP